MTGAAGLFLQVITCAVLAGVVCPVGARDGKAAEEGVDPDNLPPEMTGSLEDLLNDPEGIEPDREAVRCVNRRSGLRTEILDSGHLLIRTPVGGRVWLNRLSPGCIGLRNDMVLVIEGRGSSMCQLDTVYGQPRGGIGGMSTGRCALGNFEPITPLHAKALEDSFKLRGKEMAEARRKEQAEKRAERRALRKERRARREAEKAAATSEL